MLARSSLQPRMTLPDAVDAAAVLRLAIPNAPAQTFDLVDDYGLGFHPAGIVGRQPACCLRDAGSALRCGPIEEGGAVIPASTEMGRRPGQPSVNAVTSVSSVRPTALCRINVVISVSALATAPNTADLHSPSFDIADANLQVTFALFAAADERRIHDGDGAPAVVGWPVVAIPKLRADPQRMVAAMSPGLRPASMGSRCCRTPEATR